MDLMLLVIIRSINGYGNNDRKPNLIRNEVTSFKDTNWSTNLIKN